MLAALHVSLPACNLMERILWCSRMQSCPSRSRRRSDTDTPTRRRYLHSIPLLQSAHRVASPSASASSAMAGNDRRYGVLPFPFPSYKLARFHALLLIRLSSTNLTNGFSFVVGACRAPGHGSVRRRRSSAAEAAAPQIPHHQPGQVQEGSAAHLRRSQRQEGQVLGQVRQAMP